MASGSDNLMGRGRRRLASENDGDVMNSTLDPSQARQFGEIMRFQLLILMFRDLLMILSITTWGPDYRLGITQGLGGILVLLRYLDVIIFSSKIILTSGGQLISVPYSPWSLLIINMMGFCRKIGNWSMHFGVSPC